MYVEVCTFDSTSTFNSLKDSCNANENSGFFLHLLRVDVLIPTVFAISLKDLLFGFVSSNIACFCFELSNSDFFSLD